jgi:hypothetical protein
VADDRLFTASLSNAPFTCLRLQAEIPLKVFVFDASAGGYLTALHRILWAQLFDSYDFFSYQEDDLLVKPVNIDYLVKWHTLLEGTNLHPSLKWYEVPVQKLSNSTLNSHVPMFITACCNTFQLVEHGGEVFVYFPISYAGHYFLTQKRLKLLLSRPAWVGDIETRYHLYNEHFAHLWVTTWGFASVVPIRDMHRSLVHHQPNKYIHFLHNPAQYHYNRANLVFGVDVAEFLAVTSCCINGTNDNRILSTCRKSACFPKETAHLQVNYTFTYPANPGITVAHWCSPETPVQMKSAPCADQANTQGGLGSCRPIL